MESSTVETRSQGIRGRPELGKRDEFGGRRRAWRAVIETYGTIMPLLDEELRDGSDLDLQTYDVLLHVREAGDPGIRMTDLAQNVVRSKSGLTTLVDRLEDRCLLRRIPDAGDRRAIRITLTATGLESFRRAAEVHVTGIERYFVDHISETEAEIVADVLERVLREAGSAVPQ